MNKKLVNKLEPMRKIEYLIKVNCQSIFWGWGLVMSVLIGLSAATISGLSKLIDGVPDLTSIILIVLAVFMLIMTFIFDGIMTRRLDKQFIDEVLN